MNLLKIILNAFVLIATLCLSSQVSFADDLKRELQRMSPSMGSITHSYSFIDRGIIGQGRELGELASAASLCDLDDTSLVAHQIGVQFSAWLWEASGPDALIESLLTFQQSSDQFRKTYLASTEISKSNQCAVAWLEWRTVRKASSIASFNPNLIEMIQLASETGAIHGWVWSCHRKTHSSDDIGTTISHQASSALLFAALSSQNTADLIGAQQSWFKTFEQSLDDPRVGTSECSGIEKSLPIMDEAFKRKGNIEGTLNHAKKERIKLLGKPV